MLDKLPPAFILIFVALVLLAGPATFFTILLWGLTPGLIVLTVLALVLVALYVVFVRLYVE